MAVKITLKNAKKQKYPCLMKSIVTGNIAAVTEISSGTIIHLGENNNGKCDIFQHSDILNMNTLEEVPAGTIMIFEQQ